MKKLVLFLMVLFLSCVQPGYFPIDESYNSVSFVSANLKVFPNETMITKGTNHGRDKTVDFNQGIMYLENSIVDGLIHEIDFSSIIGNNKSALVCLQMRVIEGVDSEVFTAYFKPNGMNVNYIQGTCQKNQPSNLIFVVTDSNGKIQWYSNYQSPYDDIDPETADPGYHNYKWLQVEIWAVWYSLGTIIN